MCSKSCRLLAVATFQSKCSFFSSSGVYLLHNYRDDAFTLFSRARSASNSARVTFFPSLLRYTVRAASSAEVESDILVSSQEPPESLGSPNSQHLSKGDFVFDMNFFKTLGRRGFDMSNAASSGTCVLLLREG